MKIITKRQDLKIVKFLLPLVLAAFFGLSSAYAQRAPIDINLIIDGSSSFSSVKEEVTSWILGRLDQILVDGDKVTIWNAGSPSKVIYSGADKEAAKKSVNDLSPSGNSADFSGALREAASKQSSSYSYTLLISASPTALSSVLSGPQANLLKFSRVEEFNSWRALVVGLNLDTKVKKASTSFFAQ